MLFLQWIPRNTGDAISNKMVSTLWIGQIGWPKRRIDSLHLYSVGRSKQQLLLVKVRPTMLFSKVVVRQPLVLSGRHRRQRLRCLTGNASKRMASPQLIAARILQV